MDYLILILALIIFALGLCIFKLKSEKSEESQEVEALKRERDEYVEMGKGLVEFNQKVQEKKNKAKEKILQMLEKEPKIGAKEAAKELKVSMATARRYFDELEAEGTAKQVGKTGKNVYYSKT